MEYSPTNFNPIIFSFKKHHATYFRVPKVASTSLLISFRKVDDVDKTENLKSNFKFAFVRNPFDRLASAYRHLIHRASVGSVYNNEGIYKYMPFEEFIDVISKIPHEKLDIHFRPQYTFVPEDVNFIGKFENLTEDYSAVCKEMGIKNPPTLLWENSTGTKTDYSIFTKRCINQVLTMYARDFERFDYPKTL